MATGQILRDADGKLKRDGDGKIKLWAPGPIEPPDDFWTTINSRICENWTSSNYNSVTATLATNEDFEVLGVNSLKSMYWMRWGGFASTLESSIQRFGTRFDLSDHEGVSLALSVITENAEAHSYQGNVKSFFEADVEVDFVYQLSNVAPGSWGLDNDEHQALPVLATWSLQDLLDEGLVDPFIIGNLPDTTGYNYIYIGTELQWLKDATLPWAFDSLGDFGWPFISFEVGTVTLVPV